MRERKSMLYKLRFYPPQQNFFFVLQILKMKTEKFAKIKKKFFLQMLTDLQKKHKIFFLVNCLLAKKLKKKEQHPVIQISNQCFDLER